MDTTTQGSLKSRLHEVLKQGHAVQQDYLAHLTPAARAAHGAPDAWAPKDHIVHITAWKGYVAGTLAAAAAGETPDPEPDWRVYNDEVFAAKQDQPLDAILNEAAQTDAALAAAIDSCSEADLADPAHSRWTGVWGTCYEHALEHFGELYRAEGNLDQATAVRESVVQTAERLLGESKALGYACYNLGCFYALTGQPGKAIDSVRRALVIIPDLREWAGKDEDLATLHDDPAFQALIAV